MTKKESVLAFSLIELSIVVLIIGVLIAGATQGSRLITESKIKSSIALTRGSAVASINDLVFWLETSDVDNITSATNGAGAPEDGDKVTLWHDSSPFSSPGLNFIQANPSKQPTYVKNGTNGLPSLQFDRSQTTWLYSSSDVGVAGNTDRTLFMVFDNSIDNVSYSFLSEIFGIARNRSIDVDPGSAVTRQLAVRSAFVTDVTTSSATNAVPKGKSILMVTGYSGGTIARRNQVQIINSAILGFDYPLTTLGIGGTSDTTANALYTGLISEVILFNRQLKTSEINDIELYLSKKYAITF